MDLNATLLGQAITFALFVAFCMRYVWPPLLAAIEARQKVIADALAASEQAKKRLIQVQTEVSEQLKKAKKQAQAIIEQANKHSAQIIEDARIKALQERDAILAQMRAELEVERELIRQTLREQVGQLAIAGAQKVIERTIDAAANQDIIDQLVTELSFNKVS